MYPEVLVRISYELENSFWGTNKHASKVAVKHVHAGRAENTAASELINHF